jgi:hypothetical protein
MRLSKLNSFRIKYWMVLDSFDIWASTRKFAALHHGGWCWPEWTIRPAGVCVRALKEKKCLINELEWRLLLIFNLYLTCRSGVRNGI